MLVNVPLRDQLDEPVMDAQPDENARANCVPASLSAAFTALTGLAYYGDELKDAVYGEGYTGATDPARYIDYAAQQGVQMWEIRGAAGVLVAAIQQQISQRHPVYGAIPSQWGNTTATDIAAHGGPTHAVMFCDMSADGSTLTAMNPWPVDGHNAFYQTMDAAWWASRLVYGHVYPLEGTRPVSNVTPSWDGTAGTLTYPAHDGLPAITLVHAQASYAHSSRQNVYPLHPEAANGAGDGIVLWNDGRQTRAVKAQGWSMVLEDGGPLLAQIYAAADQVALLHQQLTAAQGKTTVDPQTAARAAAYLQIQAALAVK